MNFKLFCARGRWGVATSVTRYGVDIGIGIRIIIIMFRAHAESVGVVLIGGSTEGKYRGDQMVEG